MERLSVIVWQYTVCMVDHMSVCVYIFVFNLDTTLRAVNAFDSPPRQSSPLVFPIFHLHDMRDIAKAQSRK